MTSAQHSGDRRSNTRVVAWCLGGVIGMFGFGFAMVPLYDVFCEITGINGKTAGRYEAGAGTEADLSRTVTVQFTAQNGPDMPWVFKPEVRSIKVHPGEPVTVNFIAENPTTRMMVGQAVPSLAPSEGTLYFHKTECFCFNQQKLEAGQRVEMPLIFIVDRALPDTIHKLTLSYTLYDQKVEVEATETAASDITTTNKSG